MRRAGRTEELLERRLDLVHFRASLRPRRRGEGILPLLLGRHRCVVAWRSKAKMASRRKGGTPSPR